MRKIALLVAAFVLTLGLAQCKKEQPAAQNETEGVRITLNVGPSTGSGTNGSRVDVNPGADQHVTFANGDKILVASGGKYVGYLEHNGSGFTGTITNAVQDQKLYFYFLGNKADVSQLTKGTSTACTVNISNQTNELPVISMASSNEDYPSEGNAYSATLENQCALVEFTTNEIPVGTAVTISGMKNKLTVDFSTNTLASSEERGTITLHNTESTTKRLAILLPDDEVTTTATAEGYYESDNFSVPSVGINDYLYGENGANLELYTPLTMPLTLEAIADGTITFNNSSSKSVTYSINGGAEQTIPAVSGEVNIPVVAGNKVAFYGNSSNNQNSYFQCTSDCYIYGNIMSLVNSTGFPTTVTLGGEAPLANMFASNTHLINHPTKDLVLPATTLQSDMCYMAMFQGCTGLTRAPELPATTLSRMCYANMFQGCTGLTTAPVLPATTLKNDCYNSMFSGCSNLNSITCLATNISASGCTSNWLAGVAATGTFNRNEAMTGWTLNSPSGIPSGWTVVPPVVTIIDLTTLTSNTTVEDGTILTGTLDAAHYPSKCIKISIADEATVTLRDVTINGKESDAYPWAGLTCEGDATIILEGENTVKGFYEYYPGIQAGPYGTTLTIKGNGSLNASSNSMGAGIGGGYGNGTGNRIDCGNIVIEGGNITATGDSGSAAIGSGAFSKCGNITITGGTIKATCIKTGPGIGGGGLLGECGTITITGGDIEATGGDGAPGIGSGKMGNCGAITITNTVTKVKATKGSNAPNSIGAGDLGTCGTVTIGCTLDGNGQPVPGTGTVGPITASPYTYPQP